MNLAGTLIPFSGGRLPSVQSLALALRNHDVAYFDNGYLAQDILFLRAAQVANVPTISGHHSVILHSSDSLQGQAHNAAWRTIGSRNIRRFDAVHVLNREDGVALRALGARQVCVLHPSVDRTLFHPGPKADVPTILYVGRLHHQKGVDRLPNIITALRSLVKTVRVQIVGSGPMERAIASFAAINGVDFSPALNREDVALLMRSAWVLISPSRSETFGFVAAEAICSGTPVVCTRTNGFIDLITTQSGTLQGEGQSPMGWATSIAKQLARYNNANIPAMQKTIRETIDFVEFENVSKKMDLLLTSVASRVPIPPGLILG